MLKKKGFANHASGVSDDFMNQFTNMDEVTWGDKEEDSPNETIENISEVAIQLYQKDSSLIDLKQGIQINQQMIIRIKNGVLLQSHITNIREEIYGIIKSNIHNAPIKYLLNSVSQKEKAEAITITLFVKGENVYTENLAADLSDIITITRENGAIIFPSGYSYEI